MKTYTIPEAITLLRIDQSTLFRWVKAAGMQLQQDPHDKRRSLLTEAQLKHLASARHIAFQLHGKGWQASAATEMHVIQDETTTQMHGVGEITAHLERLETELDALKRLGDLSMVLSALDRLETRIGQIEAQVQEIAAHLQGISNALGSTRKSVQEQQPVSRRTPAKIEYKAVSGTKRIYVTSEEEVPEDAMPLHEFAAQQGIENTKAFWDRVDKIGCYATPHPARPRELVRFVTPVQQQEILSTL
jgi:archaellum component FlaC